MNVLIWLGIILGLCGLIFLLEILVFWLSETMDI